MAGKGKSEGGASGGARSNAGRKPRGYIAVELADKVDDDVLQAMTREMMLRMIHVVTQAMPKLILDEIEDAQHGDKKARERLLDRFLGKPKESVVVENRGEDKLAVLLERLAQARSGAIDSTAVILDVAGGRIAPEDAERQADAGAG